MKKFVAVLAMLGCVMAFATSAFALETSADVYAGVFDKYMWRGFNVSNSQPVLQMGADVSVSGFTVSYWTNTDLSGPTHDEVSETDIVFDYTFNAGELVSVSVGDITYQLNAPGSTHELYLGVGLDTILAPSFTAYYDWDASSGAMADGSDADGMFYAFSIGHDVELPANIGLSVGALISYNDENPSVSTSYSELHNYELSAGLSYAITDQISVDASVVYSDAISDEAEATIGDDAESTGGVNVTLAF